MLHKNNTKKILLIFISLVICFGFYTFLEYIEKPNKESYENYNIYDLNNLENLDNSEKKLNNDKLIVKKNR